MVFELQSDNFINSCATFGLNCRKLLGRNIISRARLEYSISLVRAPIGSKQILFNWYVLLLH